MIIKDEKGMYTLEIETKRNIVREKNTGFWTKEDIERFHKDYEKKVVPNFKGKPWAKYSDIRNYKTSDIGAEIGNHVQWAESTGMSACAIIVDSAISKRQMNNSKADGLSHEMQVFTDETEADEWLKAQGF